MNKHPTDQLPARSRNMSQRRRYDKRCSGGMLHDRCAISTVIAAMLIFGLLITVAAVVNVHYIPSWVKDGEAKHVRSVFTDFSKIPGSINGLALANETDIMSKQRIKLGGGNIPILSPGKSWGSLGVVPREGNFTVKASVRMVNITKNFTGNNLTDAGVDIMNVSGVSRFDIYVQKMTDNSWIYINLTNQGNRSGSAWINNNTTNELTLTIRNDLDNKIIDGTRLNRDIDWDSYPAGSLGYKIALLNPCYGFSKVLCDADIPYNLTITNSTGVKGMYDIGYNNYNLTREDYTITSNGTLMYRSMNRYFLDQTFIYQNGAVFLCQPPSASMRTIPTITIANTTNESASITIPMITGGTGVNRTPMVGGSGIEELQMKLDHLDRAPFAEGNNTDNVHIIIESPVGDEKFRRNYLREWAQYFNKTVEGTPVRMKPRPNYSPDNRSINITLNGSIHLEIQDIAIEGQVTNIAS
ncbi:MAG: hypothetical protein U9N12_07530 [Euryarchaeota archaeon]|nr:hypothetical protein [Euryarchaeota archaeon]